mmetsp:Transcript_64871/g.193315  ORF Transcript_64871/g.193315 Transcript_64871/m.193315 type:complete len:235 (+) Transcript_64871:240-944(+)
MNSALRRSWRRARLPRSGRVFAGSRATHTSARSCLVCLPTQVLLAQTRSCAWTTWQRRLASWTLCSTAGRRRTRRSVRTALAPRPGCFSSGIPLTASTPTPAASQSTYSAAGPRSPALHGQQRRGWSTLTSGGQSWQRPDVWACRCRARASRGTSWASSGHSSRPARSAARQVHPTTSMCLPSTMESILLMQPTALPTSRTWHLRSRRLLQTGLSFCRTSTWQQVHLLAKQTSS